MDDIRLGVFPAMSHCWHSHSASWCAVKVIKTLVNGIKALFGGYSVNALATTTPLLMKQHPEAVFSKILSRPLNSHQIDIPAVDFKNKYIQDKVYKLCREGRHVEVQLVFDSVGVDAVPLYYSENEPTENLNGKLYFPNCEDGEIVCESLAHAYSIGSFGRGKKAPFDAIKTKSKLESFSRIPGKIFPKNNGGLRELVYKYYAHPREAHFFPATTKDFPRVLEKLAVMNWNLPNGIENNYLIHLGLREKGIRDSHMVAIRFKKQEGCLKCICYEPNDTSRHLTVPIYNPANARVIMPRITSFYHDERGVVGCLFPSDRNHWIPIWDKTREKPINLEQVELHFYGDIDDPISLSKRFFIYFQLPGLWKGQIHNSQGDFPFSVYTNGPQDG